MNVSFSTKQFQKISLDLSSAMTILIGKNGSGKSHLLRACFQCLKQDSALHIYTYVAPGIPGHAFSSFWALEIQLKFEKSVSLLEGFFQKIAEVTQQTLQLQWKEQQIQVHVEGQACTLQTLSKGWEWMLFLILDLFQNLASWKGEAWREQEAWVLVDDIDVHLHPTTQRIFLSILSALFPKIRWIITTHSSLMVQWVLDTHQVVYWVDKGTIEQLESCQRWEPVENILTYAEGFQTGS
jgi:predicted ATP-binding protein involved in virulence